jgi:transcriptional regulator NrdR family protein
VVNAPTQAPIVVGDSNIVTFSYNTAEELINKINKSLEKEQLSEDNIETIRELLSEINDKIGKKKKMGIIKSAFVALKDFLISVGASITASVIQAHL